MSQKAEQLANNHPRQRLSLDNLAKSVWSAKMILALLIIAGFVVRVLGIRFGLPYLYHPDEPLTQNAWMMVKTNDLNPHFFGYGSLFFYVNAIVDWLYYLVGRAIGLFDSVADIPNLQMLGLGVGRSQMPSMIIVGRLLSVLFGTLCIPTAYWIGKRLSSHRVGLLAAIFVTFSAPLVTHSQFITPNMMTTFLVLFALAVLVWATTTPWRSTLSPVLIGLAFGLAVASKYNAALLVIPCGIIFFLQYGWHLFKKPAPYISAVVAGLTFFIVTPYALLDFNTFWVDTIFHLQYYRVSSHPGMEGNTVNFYLNYLLQQEGVLIFLSVIPVISYIRRGNRTGLVLASFAIPYTLYVSTLDIRNDRTILIALPILLIMTADVLDMAWRQAMKIESLRFKQAALALLATFVLFSTTYLIVKTAEINTRKIALDSREHARQWVETHVPTGTKIGLESYSPFIDPAQYSVKYFPQVAHNSPDWYREQGYEFLIFSSGQYGRFYADPARYSEQIALHETIWASFPEIMTFDQNGMTICVYQVTE